MNKELKIETKMKIYVDTNFYIEINSKRLDDNFEINLTYPGKVLISGKLTDIIFNITPITVAFGSIVEFDLSDINKSIILDFSEETIQSTNHDQITIIQSLQSTKQQTKS